MNVFSIFPERASTVAGEVDALYLFLLVVGIGMTAVIFGCVFFCAFRYHRKSDDERPKAIHGSLPLEITWSVIPFLVMMVMFAWGTELYFRNYVPPSKNTLDLYVVGKQWMWKIQHPQGKSEINELHVPVGQAVKLTLASEDVIHSFFIPAFRLKKDVVPGSYQTFWFEATKSGRYHIFCAEYCGTNHSRMIGWVTALEPADYQKWLAGGHDGESMAVQGEKLFQQYGCASCHANDTQGRCPSLHNVFGRRVLLEGGQTVTADEAYLRESILNPNATIVKGYPRDVMPVFQGQIPEEELMQLMVYLKSLSMPVAAEPASSPKSAPLPGRK
ncbi:cytochrome c oxidase subunit II [Bryobacter aggregatus]|uniref:cytochrome c oxidase subunit II n=1 Tax=Bryobacter aggregatus TaxID=360054 RepID=UPI0004E24F50|nr:cytochrome c oxidase subunit II [Bryobacter aggregatus]